MYKVSEIAQWFINRAELDVSLGSDEYMTPLKLQKLLYYAQGCHGVIRGSKLFDEKILCWEHGPVVASVYHKYKEYRNSPIDDSYNNVEIDEKTTAVLEEVNEVFGKFSAIGLRNMTHEEDPWKNAAHNEEIPYDAIIDYFKREIVVD